MPDTSLDHRFDSLEAGIGEVNRRLADLSKNVTYLTEGFHTASSTVTGHIGSVDKRIGELDSKMTARFHELDRRIADRETEATARNAEALDRAAQRDSALMDRLASIERLVLSIRAIA